MSDRRSRMVSFRVEASLVERFQNRVSLGTRSAYLETLLRWAMSSEDADNGGRRERFDTYRTGFAAGFTAAASAALDGTLRPENLEAMCHAYLRAATNNVTGEPSRRLDAAVVASTSPARRTNIPRSEPGGAPASQRDQGNRRAEDSPSSARKASKVKIGTQAREPGPKD